MGINYYSRAIIRSEEIPEEENLPVEIAAGDKTDFEWEVYPDGLRDLLIDVEQVQFKDSSIDLGLRIEKMDWDNNKVYDHVMVSGTKGDDIIKDWGDGKDLKKGDDSLTASTSSDVMANNEIMGKDGNDIIYGYGGGDRISGDGGNDFIDGGANGVEDAYGYIPKDDAIYYGKSKNYIIKTTTFSEPFIWHTLDTSEIF